ncbi:MAG TPA: sigma-70 family RNA polymerase sigma factor [Fimbriiglobus sp.]|nr:sigma-70 family RNA polymerase sigma factor [Fimbriiglobus sp.]
MSRPRLEAVLRHAAGLVARPEAPDADLLRRFVEGRDENAFAALVARHGPMVWAVCRNLLPHDPDAEDAFQATFLALVRGAGKVRAADRLAGWLHGVAVRVALKARRSAAHRRKRERAAAEVEADRPVPDAAWDELLAAVHDEVQALPEALRSAFVLCGLEGVRQHDAAARLGCTPGTLTTRLTRARQRLLAGLARRGIAPAAAAGAVGVAATTGAAVPAVLTVRAVALVRAVGPISPTVVYLAQGVIDMSARSKWLAAALLTAVGLSATVGTVVVSQAPGQPPPRGGPPGDRPPAEAGPRGRPPAEAPRGGRGGGFGGVAFGAMPRQGWEYKVIHDSLNRDNAEADLNKLGADGWELCATGERGALIFKRPTRGGGIGGPRGGGGGFGGPGNLPPGADAPRPVRRGAGPENMFNPRGEPGDRSGGGSGWIGRSIARGPVPGSEVQVLQLRNAHAEELARLMKEVFANSQTRVTVSADARSNSLIVNADPDTLKAVQALVERLDGPGPKKQ